MKKLVLLLSFLLIPTLAWPAIYYIDCNAANDLGAGTSQSTAWKTIAKVNTSFYSGDDQILFNKGCTWREQLTVPSSGTSGHAILFGAYGTGANPIIKGSDVVTGWTGASNKYSISTANNPDMVYFDGVHGTGRASVGGLTVDGDFYYDTSGQMLYIYSSSNPFIRLIEASNRYYSIDTNGKNYITIMNLSLQHTRDWGAGVRVSLSQYITMDHCDLSNNYYAGLLGSGASHGRITLSNNIISWNGGYGAISYDGFSGHTDAGYNLITLNTVSNNGWRDMEAYGISGPFSNSTVSNNVVYNNGLGGVSHAIYNHGIYATNGNAVNVIIDNNTTYGHTHGSGIKLTSSGTVKNNLSYNNASAGIQIGTNGANNITANVNYNICYGNGYGIAQLDKNTGNIILNIYNNTLYNNINTTQVGITREIMVGNNLTSLVVKNNILSGIGEREIAADTQSNMVWDYNIVHHASIYYNSKVISWAQWQALGFDTHGVNSDPLFVSTSTHDFHLQSSSPAINAGTNVGLTVDYVGNIVPIGSAPDIGAFEYNLQKIVSPPTNLRITTP